MQINSIRGKYVKKGSMEPVGVCDRSGFWFNISDLHKQMDWRGDKLVWTGLMVGYPFLDVPNEQKRPPKVSNDPQPVKNPRPMSNVDELGAPEVQNAAVEFINLQKVSFVKENIVEENTLPTITGRDVSQIDSNTRIKELNEVYIRATNEL